MYVHTKFKRDDGIEDLYFVNPLEVMTPERYTYEAALRRAEEYSAQGRYVVLALSYEAESGDFIIGVFDQPADRGRDRKSTRLNCSHVSISYAVFCLKKKNKTTIIKVTNTRTTRS